MLGTVTAVLACMNMLLAFGTKSGRVSQPIHQSSTPPTNKDIQSGMDRDHITKALLQPYRTELSIGQD